MAGVHPGCEGLVALAVLSQGFGCWKSPPKGVQCPSCPTHAPGGKRCESRQEMCHGILPGAHTGPVGLFLFQLHSLTWPEPRALLSSFSHQFLIRALNSFLLPCLPQTKVGIKENLKDEIINYKFKTSFFDIFVSISASCRAQWGREGLGSPLAHLGESSSFDPSVPWVLAPVPALPAAGRGTRAVTGVAGCLLLQLLALFRFVVLLLGYAIVRLRHWWVIAVRSHSSLPLGGFPSPPGPLRHLSSVLFFFRSLHWYPVPS